MLELLAKVTLCMKFQCIFCSKYLLDLRQKIMIKREFKIVLNFFFFGLVVKNVLNICDLQ